LLIDRFVEHRDAVADGKDERVKTLEAGAAGSDRVVETQIAAASGQRYVLDYVLRQESGGWKVVDVLVDGAISRVAAQRSEMRSMLADSGGAGLLVGLRPDLSGGILR
jgi:phospholipid transport system substrate-binding protein